MDWTKLKNAFTGTPEPKTPPQPPNRRIPGPAPPTRSPHDYPPPPPPPDPVVVAFKSPLTTDEAAAHGFDAASFKQAFTATSANVADDLFSWYNAQGFIGWQACALASQQWLINNALTIPARDAARNWFRVTKSDGGEIDPKILIAIEKLDEKRGLHDTLVEYGTNVRRFGIRLALFCVESEDPGYYEKPFNIDGVAPGSYVGISQIDPQWVAPILDSEAAANPASEGFYEPTWWQINGCRYHRSHFAISRYADLPDLLKPTYLYGGLPLTQLLLERVYDAERGATEIPMLLLTKRLNVLYTDLASVAADPVAFKSRVEDIVTERNNYGLFVVGNEDRVEQQDTTVQGLDSVVMAQYQLVAAVSNVPATKLLGMSPRGFDSSGSYEQITYYDTLKTIQRQYDRVVARHHQLIIKSHVAPRFNVPYFETETDWKPLNTPTAKERAEINLINRQADREAINSGSVLSDELRNRLITDEYSGFEGLESYDEKIPTD